MILRRICIGATVAASMGCIEAPAPPAPLVPDGANVVEHVRVDDLVLELRTATLFADDFARYRLDGEALVEVEHPYDRSCYLSGSVLGEPDSTVAVRSCEADRSDMVGVVFIDGEGQAIEHRTLRPWATRPGSCGVDEHLEEPRPIEPVISDGGAQTRRFALSSGEPRFIEVLAFEDLELTAARNLGEQAPDVALNVHVAAAIYDDSNFEDRVLPLLTGIVDTGGSDPWGEPPSFSGGTASGQYLDLFTVWLGRSSSLPRFDQATLFTGIVLDGGGTLGIAWTGGACTPDYPASLVHGVGPSDAVGSTTAHEIGHTLGLGHDGADNNCARSGNVMASSSTIGEAAATQFSSCSLAEGSQWLGSGDSWCIRGEAQAAHAAPDCGDGKVDAGEQCDCGPQGCAGRDSCCDESTCQLRSGASCSVLDGCCDESTCAPIAADMNVTCREAQSECDVAEVCNGSAVCPVDQYERAGQACSDDLGWSGACFAGLCVTRGGTCEILAGSYALDPVPYDAACGVDAGCGVAVCVAGGSCVYTTGDSPSPGSPCATGKQCFEGACVSSSSLPSADGCSQPALDSDADGTRDCDDACPYDPAVTTGACGIVDPDPDNNGMSGNNSTNAGGGGGGPGGGGSGTSGMDEPLIIITEDEGGCATAGPTSSWPAIFVLFGLLFRRRAI